MLWSVPITHNKRVNEETNGFRDLLRSSKLAYRVCGVQLANNRVVQKLTYAKMTTTIIPKITSLLTLWSLVFGEMVCNVQMLTVTAKR
jgi:hypothetical protein